jgi:hypothetical protein
MEHSSNVEASARLRAATSVHQAEDANLATSREALRQAPKAALAVSDGVARREGRGYVDSYGRGRVCKVTSCTTELSRYNPREVCAVHSGSNGGGKSGFSVTPLAW